MRERYGGREREPVKGQNYLPLDFRCYVHVYYGEWKGKEMVKTLYWVNNMHVHVSAPAEKCS